MDVLLRDLLAQNWYLEPEVRVMILENLKNDLYSQKRIEQLKTLITQLNEVQEKMLAEILERDPLFLINTEHELQIEALTEMKNQENSEHEEEVKEIEVELDKILRC